MTKTEYLTGYPPERYEAELKPLAEKRIKDMRELLSKLSNQGRYMNKRSKPYHDLVERYRETEKGIQWWIDLLNEGNEYE